MRYDRLRDPLGDAGDVPQQGGRGRVELDAHVVDARFDHICQGLPEPLGVDVVLVEADTDRLRGDLDQLSEGIEEPPGDRNGPSHRHVQAGKLLLGQRRRRVDGSAGFIDDDVSNVRARLDQLGDQALGSRGGAVSDGDDRRLVPVHQVRQRDRASLQRLCGGCG